MTDGARDNPARRPRVRLYVEHPLGAGQQVPLTPEGAHYLFSVMRLGAGDEVALFNGTAGEWRARLEPAGRRGGAALCIAQSAPQMDPPDLWLMFAPIKKARTDFIVEKAAEMGARRILPVQTDHTNAERIRRDRLQAHAVEAAEQCGGTFVPQVDDIVPLTRLLADWPAGRTLFWADESAPPGTPLPDLPGPAALLIGPEGGFSDTERARLGALAHVRGFSLGPRILRADTAAVAALTLWQSRLGDWR